VPDPRRSARLCDVWAGGTNHDLADEDRARQIEQVIPGARELARASREFLLRAVTWAARQGITDFLDLGCGLPRPDGPNIHDAARGVIPAARVVYADADLDVCDEAAVILGGEGGQLPEGLAVVDADIWQPEKTLAAARDEGLDLSRPACLVAGLVLHYLDPAAAAGVLGRYAAGIAPGSVIVVTVRRVDDPAAWARLEAMTAPGVFNHSRLDLTTAAESAGLEIVPPGAGPVGGMRPGWGDCRERAPGAAYCLGLVARKPGRG
jgi:S-adenosyl methyltransferase